MFNPRDLLLAGAVGALFLGGFGVGWAWQGARADARVLAIENKHQQDQLDLAALWRAEGEKKQTRADALSRQLAAAETHTRTVYKEVVRDIPSATLGRPCLGPDALGLLDRFAGLAPAGLPESAGEPADSGGSTTPAAPSGGAVTDTQIAGWIADAWEQHERERARCNALIEWHR